MVPIESIEIFKEIFPQNKLSKTNVLKLTRISKKYDANFDLLMAAVNAHDTTAHDIYSKEERRLNKLGNELRRRMHILPITQRV